ncbi:MAG: hypothetical protein GWN01_15250 [Nitrosopumilaceae archaeon]|nr:hypothetical protein [Nitrosopumilaceae archaeon]NIU02200.1 hypothetical protein [Nitrosopumilaceae archaeon]NIU88672.1 hypothetical protein [Nitrosopumilaceae archaeon]NIV66822.1 hypothetical protein [Nitrosopumilaceae archaeon]NIX62801.1 hypothetical protein [Nitrosopumilaceae archaeon]
MVQKKATKSKKKTATKPKKKTATKSKKSTKTKSKGTKSKKKETQTTDDPAIVIFEDDFEVDKDKINEERKAYLEEARSQEAFD